MNEKKNGLMGYPIEPLTRREGEVLVLMGKGLTSREIAERLTLAPSTVRWYIQQVYGKLGVNNKRQAVERGRSLGLLEPAVKSVASLSTSLKPKHNLPVQITHFFGREKEIEKVKKRLEEWRLVTLTGSGGVGKTRLGLAVAEQLVEGYADGVWYVELAVLEDPELVPSQVAAVLGVRENPNRPILDGLVAYLQPRQVLLILDNCEHLLDSCSNLADSLLHACPGLKILASSREPLGVDGEGIFRVPSLSFPDVKAPISLEKLEAFPAVNLFVDRARLVLPDYQVTEQNSKALARLCQRLDGIPLALELAATRVSVLTTEQLVERLDEAFRLLTGGRRTALPRHQTLRATIDWSYNLLNEKERLLFRRLSVFAGGCTLEAVETVCSGDGSEVGEILDNLSSLVSKSMILAERQPGKETRYHLLETTRQYARDKLVEAGEGETLRTRHRDYFLALVETDKPTWRSREYILWTQKLMPELNNLRRALEWSFSDAGDIEAGPRLWLAMNGLWDKYHFLEQIDWLNKSIIWCQEHPEVPPSLYIQLLAFGSIIMAFSDGQEAIIQAEQAVEFSRELGAGGRDLLCLSIGCLAYTYNIIYYDDDRVPPLLDEYKELLDELDPQQFPWGDANYTSMMATVSNQQRLYEQARDYALESIRLSKQNGFTEFFDSLDQLAVAHMHLEEYDLARDILLESLQQSDVEYDHKKPFILRELGMVEFCQGNLVQALAYCQEGLKLAHEALDPNITAYCLGLSACILAKQGDPIAAARLSGAAKSIYEKQKRKPLEDSSLDTILSGWQDGPEADAISKAFQEGREMVLDQVVAFALDQRI